MANGTIAFDTLSTSGQISGTAKSVDTDYLAYGSAKAWSHNTGTDFTLVDNLNVSSTTDNATGRPEINFSNNMSNATYSGVGGTYNRILGGYATDGGFSTTSAAFALVTSSGSIDDIGSGATLSLQIIGDIA